MAATKRHLARAGALLACLGLAPGFDTSTCVGLRRPRGPMPMQCRMPSVAATLNAGDSPRFFEDFGGADGRDTRRGAWGSDEDELWQPPAPVSYQPMELSAEELNKLYVPDSLDRHRFTVSPDAAYGAIFQWSMLVGPETYREVARRAWQESVSEDAEPLLRALDRMPLCFAVPHTIRRVTHPDEPPAAHFRLVSRFFDAHEAHFAAADYELAPGVEVVLSTLSAYSLTMALCVDVGPEAARAVLDKLGLAGKFAQTVTGYDHSTAGQMYLQAAMGMERPPSRCVVIGDSLDSVLEAHEVLMKAVAVASSKPIFELRPADLVVERIDDLSMINIRSMFKDAQAFDEGLELEREVARPTRDFWGDEYGSGRVQVMEREAVADGGAATEEQPWIYGGRGGGGGSKGGSAGGGSAAA